MEVGMLRSVSYVKYIFVYLPTYIILFRLHLGK